MADIQTKLQTLSEEFTKLQQGILTSSPPHAIQRVLTPSTDLQEAIASRQKLEAQKQENLGVQKVVGHEH
jgi:prefoldin beta subunit